MVTGAAVMKIQGLMVTGVGWVLGSMWIHCGLPFSFSSNMLDPRSHVELLWYPRAAVMKIQGLISIQELLFWLLGVHECAFTQR